MDSGNSTDSEPDGTFTTGWQESSKPCPKCGGLMGYKVWESSCGGFEDYKYKCQSESCGYMFWVDGPDS